MKTTLNTNRGFEGLSLERVSEGIDGAVLKCNVFVGVGVPSLDDQYAVDYSHQVGADLGPIHLSREVLLNLIKSLEEWNMLPLNEMFKTPLEGEFKLVFDKWVGKIDLKFGERPDVINDRKPVVTITWRVGFFQGETCFVTDPSCIRMFVEGLKSSILVQTSKRKE